jgi:hypothetical protein
MFVAPDRITRRILADIPRPVNIARRPGGPADIM